MAQKKNNAAGARKSGSGSGRTAAKKNSTKRSAAKSGTRGSSSRASSGSKAAMDKAKKNREQQQREIRSDIALVVLLIIMLLFFFSLLGFCGSVGDVLARILFGFFGRSAWGVPAWLFVLCLYLLNGTGGSRMPVRLAACALLMLVIGSSFHLRLHAAHAFSLETSYQLRAVFSMCAERADGGGIAGGWFAWILYRAFGLTGSILVYIGLSIIGVILLLQRSPAGLMRGWQERRREEGIPGFSERREQHRLRRQRELEAQENARLEREASRILEREEARSARAAKRNRNMDPGRVDLEHTRLEDGTEELRRTGGSGTKKKTSGKRNGKNNGRNNMQESRRDIHEIVLLPEEEIYEDALSEAKTGNANGNENRELFMIHGRSMPEPEGTTYRRPESFGESAGADGSYDESFGTDGSYDGRSGTDGSYDESFGADGNFGGSPGAAGAQFQPAPDLSGTAEPGGIPEKGLSADPVPETVERLSRSNGTDGIGERKPSDPVPRETAQKRSDTADPVSSGTDAPTEEELAGIAIHREDGTGRKGGGSAGRTAAARRGGSYVHPPYDLLEKGTGGRSEETERELRETAHRLQETLRTFGVQVTITDISQGPSVTRYELKPDQGVKVSRIVNLSDDIKLRLAATDIRIEAPIPGKSAIGIEVPNKTETTVHLRELLESRAFRKSEGRLPFAVGKDIGGKTVIADIARMPHLLIAGATGSGKSVCINTIILSILYRTSPEDVRLLMIDPKVVELSVYKKIPHLIIPVVTDARKASAALNWAVAEMEKRYKLFAAAGVRDLNGYNTLAKTWKGDDGETERDPLPRLVIIVDELADLMMVAKSEVESAICRLAQLARAAGIHLIIATQRPSVDVITGLIKANMPSRIAFAVSSQVDSRTILDMAGAEKLIGRGDMLFYPQNYQKPARIQGAFVSDDEVTKVVDYIRANNRADAQDREIDRQIDDIAVNGLPVPGGNDVKSDPSRDEYFAEAGRFIIEKNKASIGLLQRVFKIGFNRAARIMDQLAEAGVVSEESSTRARQVLMSMPEFEAYLEENM